MVRLYATPQRCCVAHAERQGLVACLGSGSQEPWVPCNAMQGSLVARAMLCVLLWRRQRKYGDSV